VKQLVTAGIILSRTNYGEADRIITVLTPEQGKLRLMVRGARRVKSKLAGGIELFTVSDLTYIPGKGEIGTLVSSRMQRHFGNIVKQLDRVQLGYALIKLLNRATEDQLDSSYFELLARAFAALDDQAIDLDLVQLWFQAQLFRLNGQTPNLETDADEQPLQATARYNFDYDAMTFRQAAEGPITAAHIKFLRLLFSDHQPATLSRIQDRVQLQRAIQPLIENIAKIQIR